MKKFNISEYFHLKKQIESCDVFYAALYNLLNVNYSNDIETACISFDKQGNSLEMEINEIFWSTLNETAKVFVILHELYHVIYSHGKRMLELNVNFDIGNIASDIVINHHIYEKLGIDRNQFDWKKYCWVETCFANEVNIPTNMNFEFYYNKLLLNNSYSSMQLLGTHNPIEEQIDSDFYDGINAGSYSGTFKDILDKNPELINDMAESPEFENLKNELEDSVPIHPELGQERDGKEVIYQRNDKKPEFKKLMALLIPHKKEMIDEDIEMWVGRHRRYESFLKKNSNIVLPNIKENEYRSNKGKKEIWVFMDSSGSCHNMFYMFANIVITLLQYKKINCRAFAFGDSCKEINALKPKIKYFGGNAGGFDCIEEKIQSIIKASNKISR